MITEKNIYDKGVLVALHMGRYEGRKKLSKEQLKGLPTEIVRGVHDLFDKEFKELLAKIRTIDMATREGLRAMAIPFPVNSVYFVKSDRITEVIDYLEAKYAERKQCVADAVAAYDGAIIKFAAGYPDFYKAAQGYYIGKEDFESRFYFRYQFLKIAAPDQEGLFSPDIYKKELVKFRESIQEMKKEVLATIAQTLLESAETLRDQCTEGKPNQRTLNSLNRFLTQVDDLYADFIDRDDLKQAIAGVRMAVLGVDAESLRDIPAFKKEFKDALSAAAKSVQALPDIPLKRAIEF